MVPVARKSRRHNDIFAEQDAVARQSAKVIPFGPLPSAKPAPIVFPAEHVPFRVHSRKHKSAWFDLACFLVLVVLLCCALSL